MFPKPVLFLLPFVLPLTAAAQAPAPAPVEIPAKPAAFDSPSSTDEDFPFQGEYAGGEGEGKIGVQVIALGNGEFEAVGYTGGLPGAGWDGNREKIHRTKSKRGEGAVSVAFEHGDLTGEVDGVKMYISKKGETAKMELERVDRKSPTLGAKPPEGAVVLFGGKDGNDFKGASVTEDGLLTQGATSSEKFGDFSLHIEFRLPYMPAARGQGRGNSGIYLQGRYEVQMLDSFGLDGKDNECGGLYKISAPKVNMCLPPLAWQTYDIDFTAAKVDAEGKKTANAKVSVKHNGIVIQDTELPGTTGGAQLKEDGTPGPIHLQNHGNPVRYRNIWIVRK
ncbi:MAG TPA: DUF1080 domain-containing protein [Luteolibacter sp.]|nr:DUF1080 domain-containing protein [Luteolibacter sp.]